MGGSDANLLPLYELATQAIPKHGNYDNEQYIGILIGYLRRLWCAGCPRLWAAPRLQTWPLKQHRK